MALYGTLDVLRAQCADHELLEAGIEFLQEADMESFFRQVCVGNSLKVNVMGDMLFAIFQEYDSKPLEQIKFEGHKRFIDIQYIFQGEEFIGVAGTDQIVEKGTYDEEKDLHFSAVSRYSNWLMQAGKAAILYPEDMHAPGMDTGKSLRVKKVVVKVAL